MKKRAEISLGQSSECLHYLPLCHYDWEAPGDSTQTPHKFVWHFTRIRLTLVDDIMNAVRCRIHLFWSKCCVRHWLSPMCLLPYQFQAHLHGLICHIAQHLVKCGKCGELKFVKLTLGPLQKIFIIIILYYSSAHRPIKYNNMTNMMNNN